MSILNRDSNIDELVEVISEINKLTELGGGKQLLSPTLRLLNLGFFILIYFCKRSRVH